MTGAFVSGERSRTTEELQKEIVNFLSQWLSLSRAFNQSNKGWMQPISLCYVITKKEIYISEFENVWLLN